jgi:uncharacterized membrane protein
MYDKESAIAVKPTTLAFWGTRSLLFQLMLIGAAVALPVAAHLGGAPVRWLLPMHWPVILAGLVFGWRGGATVGFISPFVSYLISGMPLPGILPAMTVELAAYGLIAGLCRERLMLNASVSVIAAIILGRIVFAITVLLTVTAGNGFGAYFQAALIPGIPATIAQIIMLPILARWWVKKASEQE